VPMAVQTPSFADVIQEHLELKRRNAELEGAMPLGTYKDSDPLDNHPLFKSEEQARLEETMDGEVVAPGFAATPWPGEDTAEHTAPELDHSLWGRSRDFDWS
jgi:predicted CopG family antitoxin